MFRVLVPHGAVVPFQWLWMLLGIQLIVVSGLVCPVVRFRLQKTIHRCRSDDEGGRYQDPEVVETEEDHAAPQAARPAAPHRCVQPLQPERHRNEAESRSTS